MAAMSLEEFIDEIIDHYARRFQTNPTTIFSNTDLKVRFNFGTAAWAAEAEALSALPFMRRLGVRIAQIEMVTNTTPEKLARLIERKAEQRRAKKIAAASKASKKKATKKKATMRKAARKKSAAKKAKKKRKKAAPSKKSGKKRSK
jgi:hypothetical protein